MKLDLHSHSVNSSDGACSVAGMCRAAAEQGIGVFAITDHCDVNTWERHDLSIAVKKSFEEIEAEKPNAGVKLLTGVELGEALEAPDKAEWVLESFSWDIVIGSLHNTSGDPDFYFMDFLHQTEEEIALLLKKYYQELVWTAERTDFDTLAHITYPYRYINAAKEKRPVSIRPERFDGDADRVFKALIKRGKALELNTSSIARSEEDKRLNFRYFRRYRELGGELVTVGSDAHTPETVGKGIDTAYAFLREAGFLSVVWYEERNPVFTPLDTL